MHFLGSEKCHFWHFSDFGFMSKPGYAFLCQSQNNKLNKEITLKPSPKIFKTISVTTSGNYCVHAHDSNSMNQSPFQHHSSTVSPAAINGGGSGGYSSLPPMPSSSAASTAADPVSAPSIRPPSNGSSRFVDIIIRKRRSRSVMVQFLHKYFFIQNIIVA